MFLLDVVGRFGVFYHNKKRDAEFCQNPVPQKSNFYRRLRLLQTITITKFCTDYYDNNEY